MVKVTSYTDIDLDALDFAAPRVNAMGGQSIGITYDGDKLRVELPTCRLPFGLNCYNNKYSVDVSVNDATFKEFVSNFDACIQKTAFDNTKLWFNKTLSEDSIGELYKKCLKVNNPKYDPLMCFKFNPSEASVFDYNKNAVSYQNISKGNNVKIIAELIGVYFVAKEFGTTWKVIQLKLMNDPVKTLSEYAFIDDDEQEDAEPA